MMMVLLVVVLLFGLGHGWMMDGLEEETCQEHCTHAMHHSIAKELVSHCNATVSHR